MKKILILLLLFCISVILLYLSLIIGELLVSLSFLAAAVLYKVYRRQQAALGVITILLVEAVLVLFSFNLINKFDAMLKDRLDIQQVYPIKPNYVYKSFLISIENITNTNPINAAEIYLAYDTSNVTIIDIKPQDQFLKITLAATTDKNKGLVYIAGGLPNPGYTAKSALFAQVFVSQAEGTRNDLTVGKGSRILVNDGKGTNLAGTRRGPYFKLVETPNTNAISAEATSNTRQILRVSGFLNKQYTSKIHSITKSILSLNSKVLKK